MSLLKTDVIRVPSKESMIFEFKIVGKDLYLRKHILIKLVFYEII